MRGNVPALIQCDPWRCGFLWNRLRAVRGGHSEVDGRGRDGLCWRVGEVLQHACLRLVVPRAPWKARGVRLWHRLRDLFGLSRDDFAVEGDRVVFRVLDRARELPLEPTGGSAEISACARCGKPTKRVCFTTAGSGQDLRVRMVGGPAASHRGRRTVLRAERNRAPTSESARRRRVLVSPAARFMGRSPDRARKPRLRLRAAGRTERRRRTARRAATDRRAVLPTCTLDRGAHAARRRDRAREARGLRRSGAGRGRPAHGRRRGRSDRREDTRRSAVVPRATGRG